jgi:hypothetical protein
MELQTIPEKRKRSFAPFFGRSNKEMAALPALFARIEKPNHASTPPLNSLQNLRKIHTPIIYCKGIDRPPE